MSHRNKIGQSIVEKVVKIFDAEFNEPAQLCIHVTNVIKQDGLVYFTLQTKNKRGIVLTNFEIPPMKSGDTYTIDGLERLFKIEVGFT